MTEIAKSSLVKLSLERFVLYFDFRYLDLFRIWCLGFGIFEVKTGKEFLSYHVKTGNEFCQGFLGLKQLML